MNVKFVDVSKPNAGKLPVKEQVLLPRLIVRVLVLLDDRDVAVTLKLLVVKVPWVTVSAPEDVRASPSVTVIPEPLTVTGPIVLPAVVSVPVALSVNVPE